MTTDPPAHPAPVASSASSAAASSASAQQPAADHLAATTYPPELRACYRQAVFGALLPLCTGVGIFLLWLPLRGLSEPLKHSLEFAGHCVLNFCWIPLLWGLTWLLIFAVRARRRFAWPWKRLLAPLLVALGLQLSTFPIGFFVLLTAADIDGLGDAAND